MPWRVHEICVQGGIHLSHTQPVHAGFVAAVCERLEARQVSVRAASLGVE